MSARDYLAAVEDAVMSAIDPEGYGWASGDAPSVREVIEAMVSLGWTPPEPVEPSAAEIALGPIEALIEMDGGVFLKKDTKIRRVQEDRRHDLGAIVTTSMVAVNDVRKAIDAGRDALLAATKATPAQATTDGAGS